MSHIIHRTHPFAVAVANLLQSAEGWSITSINHERLNHASGISVEVATYWGHEALPPHASIHTPSGTVWIRLKRRMGFVVDRSDPFLATEGLVTACRDKLLNALVARVAV